MDAYQPTRRIQETWTAATFAAARVGVIDETSAIFSVGGGESVTVYFSPSTELIARAFGATPCEKPPGDRIGLLAGDGRAWDIHFPGEVERRRAHRS